MVKELLMHPQINVNIQSKNGGYSALLVACTHNNIEIIEALLSVDRTDVNMADNDGWTPLLVAVSRKSCPAVTALIRAGARDLEVTVEKNGMPKELTAHRLAKEKDWECDALTAE